VKGIMQASEHAYWNRPVCAVKLPLFLAAATPGSKFIARNAVGGDRYWKA